MKAFRKYRCEARDGRVGFAVYYPAPDSVQFTHWGVILEKDETGSYQQKPGYRRQWLGRPTDLIDGYKIGDEWTTTDQRIFDNEGRSRRDALEMGFSDLQMSLFDGVTAWKG